MFVFPLFPSFILVFVFLLYCLCTYCLCTKHMLEAQCHSAATVPAPSLAQSMAPPEAEAERSTAQLHKDLHPPLHKAWAPALEVQQHCNQHICLFQRVLHINPTRVPASSTPPCTKHGRSWRCSSTSCCSNEPSTKRGGAAVPCSYRVQEVVRGGGGTAKRRGCKT